MKRFLITALGRNVDVSLTNTVKGTLWHVTTRAALASTNVGSTSQVIGSYAFITLPSSIEVSVGQEYRVSLECVAGMADKRFDGYITNDAAAYIYSHELADKLPDGLTDASTNAGPEHFVPCVLAGDTDQT